MFPKTFYNVIAYLCCFVSQGAVSSGASDVFQCGNILSSQIVGKRAASEQDVHTVEFPWQVKLRSFGTVFCTGVLVHPRFLVTAARCFRNNYNPQLWSAVLGDGNSGIKELIVHVETIFIYGSYEVDPYRHDVAVVKLAAHQSQSDFQPVCLPRANTTFYERTCVLTGWGPVNSGSFARKLQKQTVYVEQTDKCTHRNVSLNPSSYLCVFSKTDTGLCQGVSGGSVICVNTLGLWELAGLAYEEFGCKNPRRDRGLYTNIAKYVSWIEKIIIKKL